MQEASRVQDSVLVHWVAGGQNLLKIKLGNPFSIFNVTFQAWPFFYKITVKVISIAKTLLV